MQTVLRLAVYMQIVWGGRFVAVLSTKPFRAPCGGRYLVDLSAISLATLTGVFGRATDWSDWSCSVRRHGRRHKRKIKDLTHFKKVHNVRDDDWKKWKVFAQLIKGYS